MPASFIGRSAVEWWQLPWDDAGDFVPRIVWCCQQCRGPADFSWYGFTHPAIESAMADLASRCDLQGVFDRTQEAGPSEKPVVLTLFSVTAHAYTPTLTDRPYAVGTSPEGGAINHDKQFVWNAPRSGYQPATGDYDTLEDAFAAGACVSLSTSYNPGRTSTQQTNFAVFMPGIDVGGDISRDIQKTRTFALTHQPQYQPVP